MRHTTPLLFAACGLALLTGCSAPEVMPYLRTLEASRSASFSDWEPFLHDGRPAVRAAAWRAIARGGALEGAEKLLAPFRGEEDPSVIVEACFAFSRLEKADAQPLLERCLDHHDARVRSAALRALSFLPWAQCWEHALNGLDDPHPLVRAEGAAALARLFGVRATPAPDIEGGALDNIRAALCVIVVADRFPYPRWRAMYAISELMGIEDLDSVLHVVKRAAKDQTAIRFFAARTCARLAKDPRSRSLLVLMARDPSWPVAVAALLGLEGQSLGRDQLASLRALLEERLAEQGVYHVRLALVGALAGDPDSSDLLQRVLERDESRSVRVAAFLALHRDRPARWAELRNRWMRDEDAILREAAVRACADLADPAEVLPGLVEATQDRSPLVRAASLEVLFGLRNRRDEHEVLRRIFAEQLREGDLGAAGTVVDGLAAARNEPDGAVWIVELEDSLRRASTRFTGVEGLELLPKIAALLGEEAPALSPAEVPFTKVDLAEIERDPHPRLRLRTERGEFVVELDGETAPRHSALFLDFARSGRYDGTVFHRMVLDFVLQGLDPRGDGWGCGGVRLPNEIDSGLFGAHSLGMPDSGIDTGGCQVFVPYVPVPRLEGRYTRFGRIVEGVEVFERLERGDRVLGID